MAVINIPPKQDDPQRLIMLNGVPQKFWLSAEEINTIIKYLAALLGAETSLYKGEYDYLEELEAAHPLPEPGSEAQIKVVDGDNLKASWDNTNKKWFLDGTWIPPGTDAAYLLKSIYDPDGDGSVLKADAATDILSVLTASGTKYYGTRNGVAGVWDFPTQSGGGGTTPEQTKIFSVQRIPIGGLKEKIIFDYMFNGVYFQGTTEVTHPAADTVLPRIDGFSLTDEGTAIINPGTPSENPGNPSVEDPLTQIATSLFVLIPANATEPEGISIVTIFDESGSSGSGEWDLVENSNGRINLLSESDPSSGSFCIEGTALRKNDSFHATPTAPIAITGGQSITLEYKPKALNQAMLNILAYYTGADGNTYTEWLPRLGFNAGSLARQFISAKLSQAYTHLQQLGFINPNGNNVTYGFFIDEIKLIGGAGSTAPGDYATKAELNALKDRVTTLEENSGGLDTRMANLVADLSTAEKDAIKAKLGIVSGLTQDAIDEVITVNTSRDFAVTDIGKVLFITATVTLTYPAGGIPKFKCNIMCSETGLGTLAGQTAELDFPDGQIIEARKAVTLFLRPDDSRLTGYGEFTE